jgi:hypothetical protein
MYSKQGVQRKDGYEKREEVDVQRTVSALGQKAIGEQYL